MTINFHEAKRFTVWLTLLFIFNLLAAHDSPAQTRNSNAQKNGRIEQVFAFQNQMPTGVTVSQSGRIFVNYPRWEDKVDFTVAEIVGGREVPFPDQTINRLNLQNPG